MLGSEAEYHSLGPEYELSSCPRQTLKTEQTAVLRSPHPRGASPSHRGLVNLVFYLTVLVSPGRMLPSVSQGRGQYLGMSDTDLLPRPHPAWNAVAMERHQQACATFRQHKLEDHSSSRSPGPDLPGCGLGVGQGNSGPPPDSPRLEMS